MFGRLVRAATRRQANGRRQQAKMVRHALLALCAALLVLAIASTAAGLTGRAPILRVHGQTLKWTAIERHSSYVLQTTVAGQRTTTRVSGLSVKPPAIPGRTATYRVRAAGQPDAWSNRASIRYRRSRTDRPPPEEKPPAEEPPKEEPPKEEPPKEEPRPEESVGRPKFRLDAASYFDPFATAQYAPWVKARISLIKGYPPFSDSFLSLFGLPVIGYHDPATEGQAPLNASNIETVVAEVRRDMNAGYAGVFLDDANWSPGFSPSPGSPAALAKLLLAIRAAAPKALIEMNSQFHDIWPLIKANDPNVDRALETVNLITKEFGVGPSAGISSAADYAEFFEYIDRLHAKGIHLVMTGDRNSTGVSTLEYNLATYLLGNDGGDYINGTEQTPRNWWTGFDAHLGEARTGRERSSSGLWTRAFAGGVVYTVEPGASTQTIKLSKPMHSAEWGTVESVTLSAGQGAVLVG
jgi:hypothetical protein